MQGLALESPRYCRNLQGIACGRSGSMSLNVQCLQYVDASFVVAISDELLLCHVAGRSDGRCFSILIKRCLSDDDSDRIMIGQGLWEGF